MDNKKNLANVSATTVSLRDSYLNNIAGAYRSVTPVLMNIGSWMYKSSSEQVHRVFNYGDDIFRTVLNFSLFPVRVVANITVNIFMHPVRDRAQNEATDEE